MNGNFLPRLFVPSRNGSHDWAKPYVPGAYAAAGFTLIELMFTVMVAAVLLTLAIPSFLNLIVSNQLVTAANDTVAAIDATRMAAIKYNASAQFCSDTEAANIPAHEDDDPADPLGAACGTKSGAVYALANGSAIQVLAASNSLSSLLSGHVAALRCNALGVCSKPGSSTPFSSDSDGSVATLCSGKLNHDNIYTISMTGGSVTQITKSTGVCS